MYIYDLIINHNMLNHPSSCPDTSSLPSFSPFSPPSVATQHKNVLDIFNFSSAEETVIMTHHVLSNTRTTGSVTAWGEGHSLHMGVADLAYALLIIAVWT